jgi:hypothetical protein
MKGEKMKLNLYYPPYPAQIFKGSEEPVNPVRPFCPKSSLYTLASGIRKFSDQMRFDCNIEIIDLQVNGELTFYKSISYGPQILDCYQFGTQYKKIENKIKEGDIHGITSNHTNAAQIVADLIKFIKRVNPKALLVVGGTDATARPFYYLKNGADLIVKGGGEYIFSRIIDAWSKGNDINLIPNICTKDNPNDLNVDMSYLLDLDSLEPMALDLINDLSIYTDTAEGPPPLGVKPNFICFETSRGCAWGCSFCTAPTRGKYRTMSPRNVERHLKYFKSLGIKTIVWQEDNPLSRLQQTGTGRYLYEKGRSEVLEIFHLARDYGFAWEFANGLEFCKFRPDGSNGKLDHELMDALLWSKQINGEWQGCYRVQIPLDNLNLEEKKRFPKLLNFEEQLEILSIMVKDYKVHHQTYDLFIGYPEQNQAVLDKFIQACIRIKHDLSKLSSEFKPYFNVFNLSLLPGSQDYKNYKHLLAFDIEQNPEVIGIFLSAMNTEHFTYYETYQKRVEMCNLLNDKDLIIKYDGIYTGTPKNNTIIEIGR